MTCPSVEGVKPEIGAGNRLLDRMDHRAVPDLDVQKPRLRHADRRQLIERHVVAIGLDLDVLEQRRRSAAGAQAASSCLSEAIAPCMRRLRSFMSNVAVAMVSSAIRPAAFAPLIADAVSRPW